jgi:hypothetical protein
MVHHGRARADVLHEDDQSQTFVHVAFGPGNKSSMRLLPCCFMSNYYHLIC